MCVLPDGRHISAAALFKVSQRQTHKQNVFTNITLWHLICIDASLQLAAPLCFFRGSGVRTRCEMNIIGTLLSKSLFSALHENIGCHVASAADVTHTYIPLVQCNLHLIYLCVLRHVTLCLFVFLATAQNVPSVVVARGLLSGGCVCAATLVGTFLW